MAPAFLRQTWALVRKNLIINLRRHYPTTMLRSFLLPVLFVSFLSFSRFLLLPPVRYGIGTAAPVVGLRDALAADPSKKLVLVTNGLGREVDELVAGLQRDLAGAGSVLVRQHPEDLRSDCQQTLLGVSFCFAAVVFTDSPNAGSGAAGNGSWRYMLRGDIALSDGRIDVTDHENKVQQTLLPLQLAVDKAIARQEGRSVDGVAVSEYMFTNKSQDEYEKWLRTRFSAALINYLSVAYLVGMIGIVYHLVGFQAMEREKGLSTLIEAMGGSKFARMASYHLSFSFMYTSGWVIMSLGMWGGLFRRSSPAILVIWHITAGWALASWAMFLGSIFKKAQLSGVSAAVVSLALGVVAQVSKTAGTGTFAVLSFLFPPMNYVFYIITLARWEGQQLGASVVRGPPDGNSRLPVVAFWVFSLVHALAFPVAAAFIERYLFGTASPGHRHIGPGTTAPGNAVELRRFTKRYPPRLLTHLFGSHKETVVAVNDLTLNVLEGQVMVLLGANGSGKTTTLEAIAGLAAVREGDINISAGAGGIGICPQKNVLWDDLTVEEHVRIWNLIKCAGDSPDTQKQLIADCDLTAKSKAKSKTLSGGQKRKLQLAAMLTGGSAVCAIDEVSSGLDPLSRRKIWDIVLAARGTRTILMTSHSLDEADLLADHIAILSRGHLKCEGSAVQLKTQYGGGYRVHAPLDAPAFSGVAARRSYDRTTYNVAEAGDASSLVEGLDRAGVADYYVAGPSIEDVFLKVAEETSASRSETETETQTDNKNKLPVAERDVDQISAATSHANSQTEKPAAAAVHLHTGRPISIAAQTRVLIRKRITILQRGYLPTMAAIAIPIIAAGLTMLTFKSFRGVSCTRDSNLVIGDTQNFTFDSNFDVVLGPRDRFSAASLLNLSSIIAPASSDANLTEVLRDSLHYVDTMDQFNAYIKANYHNVTPGGIFQQSDSSATYAFMANNFDASLLYAMTLQNVADNLLLGVPGGITTQYRAFDFLWPPGQGDTLLFITYACLAFAVFPAFFALYPTAERLRNVRALHYSNGVRVLPLWLAHTIFDMAAVLAICVVCLGLFAGATSGWYGLGYLFVVMLLYGLTSILFVYCISLATKSQLASFAFAAGIQAALFFIYFLIYLSIITYADLQDQASMLEKAHYVVAALSPIVNLQHAFFVSLNSFQISCSRESLISYPGTFKLYGSSIALLLAQAVLFFAVLVAHDSGKLRFGLRRRSSSSASSSNRTPQDEEDRTFDEKEVTDELQRVTSSNDGLRVMHLSKKFKKFQAVDDVTFGVPRGEVFALLGPNGAGKTTTINMIRGELPPTAGEVFVKNVPVGKDRTAARAHLGVCPQFDAVDRMTVTEHLAFYARIRGVADVDYNVAEVIRAVGLDDFRFRVAEKLSGGNKRKLSLAIALMGNPAVLLLDEPSSGMDAAAKRVMWRILETVAPGRSLVLTTHSMEECSALASRAGILAKRMLALGTTEQLRRKYGDKYLVHLVLSSAPHSSPQEMDAVKAWIATSFPGAELEARSFGGQVRFSIPARGGDEGISVGTVFRRLEREGPGRGVQFWSVDRGTMDMVFLDVVGRAGVREEGDGEDSPRKRLLKKIGKAIFCPWMFLVR